MEKNVYACFSTDIIHEGHLNIIREAKKLGRVIAGVMSDAAMISYYRFPTKTFSERREMIATIEGVSETVVQEEVSYSKVIEKIRPDFVIHGDRWNTGPWYNIRKELIDLLETYGGKLVEVPYTISQEAIKSDRRIIAKLMMPEFRRKRLRQLLNLVMPVSSTPFLPVIKAMEVHSGLTGLIVEKTIVEKDTRFYQFDAMWISSLCDSLNKGKPDIELVDMTSRFRTIEDIMEVTTKPIIMDGDTGGLIEHFVYNVRTMERLGISAVIVEDKMGLKRNSLLGNEVEQTQAPIQDFCKKINAAKNVLLTDDFMIIARIESLILEKGLNDALIRAFAYVEAGADAIMIHSRKKVPDEIFAFCDAFRLQNKITPLVAVPTTFNGVTEDELAAHGVNIVIYANQLTRIAFPAMQHAVENILMSHRAKEIDSELMPIKEVLTLIDEF